MKHFFDIGANVGQTFDYLATLNRDFREYRFWMFEPSPRHLLGLLAKCESVKDRYDVTVCPFGVGRMSRSETFFEKDDVLGDSFHEWHASDHVPSNRSGSYKVRSAIVSIADVIADCTGPNDEIIMDIDAEGGEFEILDGLMRFPRLSCRVREIWVEWHRIDPVAEITPQGFAVWCADRGIVLVHRGLQNVA